MRKKLKITIAALSLIATSTFAQISHQFSVGASIPDNISNRYLKTGLYFSYGIDFKLKNNLFFNSNISASYNGASPDYRYGIDDDLYLKNHPEIKKQIEEDPLYDITDPDFYGLYLFNPCLSVNLKYVFLSENKLSPYIGAGLSGNFSFYRNFYDVFTIRETWPIADFNVTGPEGKGEFSLGYQGLCGVNYKINNRKSIFVEMIYRKLPGQKFGMLYEQTGLFLVHFGISSTFGKKD